MCRLSKTLVRLCVFWQRSGIFQGVVSPWCNDMKLIKFSFSKKRNIYIYLRYFYVEMFAFWLFAVWSLIIRQWRRWLAALIVLYCICDTSNQCRLHPIVLLYFSLCLFFWSATFSSFMAFGLGEMKSWQETKQTFLIHSCFRDSARTIFYKCIH